MKEQLSQDSILTTDEAAEFLKLAPKTLINMRTNKCGPPFVKLGRIVRYRFRDILKYLNQNLQDPSVA